MTPHPYEHLTPDTLLQTIESCEYPCSGHFLTLNSYENRVFQVGIEDAAPLIAKFYRPGRWSDAQIQEEHDFSLELAAAEWPVVAPIPDPAGATLRRSEHFRFALFERRGGRAPELDDLNNLEVLGRQLGRLHAIGAQQPFAHRPALTVSTYGQASRDYLLGEDKVPASLRPAYDSLSLDLLKRLQALESQYPVALIRVHGDCHLGNILWRDEAPLFVDFDDCRMGPAVQDLWLFLSGERPQQALQLDALLEGYEQFHHFDNRELHWIEPLRTLRMMHFVAWLASRWSDPAFPLAFPWFNSERFWAEHINDLRAQLYALDEPVIERL